jgi:uncharacterized protein YbjT (DUF2867 family)
MNVLIIGATGYLGGMIVKDAKREGYVVTALVRHGSNADGLKAAGVRVIRGDITKPGMLENAFKGVDAVVTTAIGYVSRRPEDTLESVDNQGNKNIADACIKAGVKRLVFISVLTAEKATEVKPFYQKYLSENYFDRVGLAYVSLRPGAFLDAYLNQNREQIQSGVLPSFMYPKVPITMLHSTDIARIAVDSIRRAGIDNKKIDLGTQEPLTHEVLALELGKALNKHITVEVINIPNAPPLIKYFQSGLYVADTKLQEQYFGRPSSLSDSVQYWVDQNFI